MLNKLSKIDQLTVGDHYYLSNDDEVWYFAEYSSGKGYVHSPANQLITNLKHGVEFRTEPPSGRWYYKNVAIEKVGRALASVIGADFRNSATFVPIPPSVVRTDDSYDGRMSDVLQAFKRYGGGTPDVRELIYQAYSTRKSHESDERVTQAELLAAYRIDEAICAPPPHTVALIDDMLTTGTHFLAARQKVLERFPGIRVLGIFVCRRKLASPFEGLEVFTE